MPTNSKYTEINDYRFISLILTVVSLAVYAWIRLVHLDKFPIYFFCDEAWFGNKADELIQNNLHDANGRLLPVYFEKAAGRWFPQISTYFYILPVYLWGKSIEVIRATSLPFTLLGAVFLTILTHSIYKTRESWISILIFSAIPVWLMHSRTAFEPIFEVVFYAGAVLFYAMYRNGKIWALPLSAVMAALVAYAHFGGTIVILAFSSLLLIIDFKYHLQNYKIAIFSLVLCLLLAIPTLQFKLSQSSAVVNHLATIDSPWLRKGTTIKQNILEAGTRYVHALGPDYWFSTPQPNELERHRWKNRGFISQWMLPPFILGIFVCLMRLHLPEYRILFVALLSSCAPVLLVDIGIFRIISYLVSAAVFCAIGADVIISFLSKMISRPKVALLFCLTLSIWNFKLINEALNEAPTWYNDYQLYGMQWGANELFGRDGVVNELIDRKANMIYLSPNWANGVDTLVNFFYSPLIYSKFRLMGMSSLTEKKFNITADDYFIMLESEYENLSKDLRFGSISTVKLIQCPNGKECFRVVQLSYAQEADAMFMKENELRKLPKLEKMQILGNPATVTYPLLDMGTIVNAFDDDSRTLIRGYAANPLELTIDLEKPQIIRRVVIGTGLGKLAASVKVANTLTNELHEFKDIKPVKVEIDQEFIFDKINGAFNQIVVSVVDLNYEAQTHIHVREVKIE